MSISLSNCAECYQRVVFDMIKGEEVTNWICTGCGTTNGHTVDVSDEYVDTVAEILTQDQQDFVNEVVEEEQRKHMLKALEEAWDEIDDKDLADKLGGLSVGSKPDADQLDVLMEGMDIGSDDEDVVKFWFPIRQL